MRRTISTLALSLTLALGLAACAPSAEPIDLEEGTVLLDVRTPGEFASGHLEGALNIDVQAADFDARVAELDPDAAYVVYCRTGNRSGQAIARMEALGFTDLTNGGSVESAAAATGIPIITD